MVGPLRIAVLAIGLFACADGFEVGASASAGSGGGAAGPVCGDGALDAGEQCDDGNTKDDDGCSDCAYDCKGAGELDARGNCYRFVAEPVSWQDAEQACLLLDAGFALAALSSQEELTDVVAKAQVDIYWLGANDFALENTFTWVNGERWIFTHGNPPWNAGEPNNMFDEDCLEKRVDGINDALCDTLSPYLCERAL